MTEKKVSMDFSIPSTAMDFLNDCANRNIVEVCMQIEACLPST